MQPFLTPEFFDFFRELSENNHKAWFDAQRPRYQAVVKEPFERLVGELQIAFNALDPELPVLKPSDAIFRIHRDVRFSKDKTPYKVAAAAYFSKGGRKTDMAGFYLHLGFDEKFVACGRHEIDSRTLTAIRSELIHRTDEFISVLEEENFKKTFGEIKGEKNKIVAKEFREHLGTVPYLSNKQFFAVAPLTEETVLSEALVPTLMQYYASASPFNHFLNEIVADI